MFTDAAPFYDHFSTYKDYPGEAAAIREIVARLNPTATRLLDVACGTGRHIEHLREWFACEGADVDAGMLDVARARLPETRFTEADMTTLSLGRRFDVVTCLFSAIGYSVTVDGFTPRSRTWPIISTTAGYSSSSRGCSRKPGAAPGSTRWRRSKTAIAPSCA